MYFGDSRKERGSDASIEKLTRPAFAYIPNLSSPLSHLTGLLPVYLSFSQDAVAPIAANP